MRYAPLGHPTTVGALQAGACFVFDLQGQTLVGIKVIDDFAAHPIASCVAIWPGHSELGDRPSFLDGSFGPGTGVYELSDVHIVPAAELSTWRVGADLAAEAGTIVLGRERMMLAVARRNGKVAFIDIAAGKTVALPDNMALLYVDGWRLVQKVFGSYATICCYPGPGAMPPIGAAAHALDEFDAAPAAVAAR